MLDQRGLNYDEKSSRSDLVALLRTNIEFETNNKIEGNKPIFLNIHKLIVCFYYLEAKKRMDLDVIIDDKDDLQSKKKKIFFNQIIKINYLVSSRRFETEPILNWLLVSIFTHLCEAIKGKRKSLKSLLSK